MCGVEAPFLLNVPQYQWDKDGVSVGTSWSSTLMFSPLTLDDGGEYRCTATISLLNSEETYSLYKSTTVTVKRKHLAIM